MSDKEKNFCIQSVIKEFEDITKDAENVQKETLKKILEMNKDAEYLQNLGLGDRNDIESFKACVPLVSHDDLNPYIQRIIDGDRSPILTGAPVTSFSMSSGTTKGEPKFVPFNKEWLDSSLQILKTSSAFRNRAFSIGKGKALMFIYGSKEFKTKGGLIATTATTNQFRSEQFKHEIKDMHSQCTSPEEVIFGPDFHQSLYCHLLCGLIYSDEVQFVFSAFASCIVIAFRTFEKVWGEICNDIRTGVLSSRVTAPTVRTAVSKLLRPNPELADSIYNKCVGLSSWYGVIPELWPNAKYVYGIMTGSMEPYLKKLRHYAGNMPLIGADYGASEGWIGVNIDPELPPELVTFAVLPNIGYFEFIPLREKAEILGLGKSATSCQYKELEPVGLTEVEVGEEYEIVLTSFTGFYRYRLDDIVRVAGFHNSTPKLQFVCRKSMLLSVNVDKNTEKDLQIAVEEANKLLAAEDLEVVDFSSYVDMSTEPGHYVIFWELSGDASKEVLSSCCDCLDRAFVDPGYVGLRKGKAIGPLELRVLRKGTFYQILVHHLSLGAAVSQFQIMCDNVIENYFSAAYD